MMEPRKTSDSRTRILSKIRSRLSPEETEAAREEAVARRLKSHLPNLIPERAKQPAKDLLNRFQTMLEDQGATVLSVNNIKECPATITAYLKENGIPLILRHGQDPLVASLPWNDEPDLGRETGPAKAEDLTAVSMASIAAAETGTLFLLSGQDNPTTLNFLPENHIILIERQKILGSYEDCWDYIRRALGETVMPRVVNWISGPSRTADIEQTLIRGAHGPKRLCVLIYG